MVGAYNIKTHVKTLVVENLSRILVVIFLQHNHLNSRSRRKNVPFIRFGLNLHVDVAVVGRRAVSQTGVPNVVDIVVVDVAEGVLVSQSNNLDVPVVDRERRKILIQNELTCFSFKFKKTNHTKGDIDKTPYNNITSFNCP